MAAARSSASSSVARKVQFAVEPGLRPVRPMRCKKDETLLGASIWITWSRSPTSMPNSKALVATINAWNRLAIAARSEPGHYKPAAH